MAYFIINKAIAETRLRNELYQEKKERERIEKDSRDKLISMMVQLPDNKESIEDGNPLDRDLLKRTTDFIERNIENQELDIPLLCREVGVSRSLFFNKFKALSGMTPNAFILNYRLKYAANLLKTHHHLSITEIADKSGFSSALYFSRCFKKQYGISPLTYRKQQEGDAN